MAGIVEKGDGAGSGAANFACKVVEGFQHRDPVRVGDNRDIRLGEANPQQRGFDERDVVPRVFQRSDRVRIALIADEKRKTRLRMSRKRRQSHHAQGQDRPDQRSHHHIRPAAG